MVDKGHIFTEVTKRNAIRRQAGLPLLNVAEEYGYQVALANEREYQKFCDGHRDIYDRIKNEVIAEIARTCPSFNPRSLMGYYRWGPETRRRFEAHLVQVYGVTKPAVARRHTILYGR